MFSIPDPEDLEEYYKQVHGDIPGVHYEKQTQKGSAIMETYTPTAVQGTVSGNFQQVLRWSIKEKPFLSAMMQIMTVPFGVLAWFAFSYLGRMVGKFDGNFQFDITAAAAFVAGIPATIILHELVHGQTMRLFGARPRYGAMLTHLLFYATAPGYGFRRNAYILVEIAPLVVLSCLAVLGMIITQGTIWVALLAVWATVNAGGAWGDLWLISIVLHYPKTAYVVDEQDGMRVLLCN